MSTGKYSPLCPHSREKDYSSFVYNCYGFLPDPNFDHSRYDEKLHFANYDDEGFDSYGYSSFDADGNYVGAGNGIDRYGYTEMDYLTGGDLYYDGNFTRMHAFIRN